MKIGLAEKRAAFSIAHEVEENLILAGRRLVVGLEIQVRESERGQREFPHLRVHAARIAHFEFDRKAFEFFCRRNGARWDRAGRILVKPRSGETVTPLWSYFTILAFDRHIMVSPNISSQVHDLW